MDSSCFKRKRAPRARRLNLANDVTPLATSLHASAANIEEFRIQLTQVTQLFGTIARLAVTLTGDDAESATAIRQSTGYGTYSSDEDRVFPLSTPPVISTLPLDSNVATWNSRPVVMLPVVVHVPVARSYSSAED